MEITAGTSPTTLLLPGTGPLRLGLTELADESVALARRLERDLEPLERLGEDLIRRIQRSAHMA